MRCFCGCGECVVHRHHCVYRQHLRNAKSKRTAKDLEADERNLVPVAFACHGNHHSRSKPYGLAMLPDSVFEFAAEVLGTRASNYLRRRYTGDDPRLEAMA